MIMKALNKSIRLSRINYYLMHLNPNILVSSFKKVYSIFFLISNYSTKGCKSGNPMVHFVEYKYYFGKSREPICDGHAILTDMTEV